RTRSPAARRPPAAEPPPRRERATRRRSRTPRYPLCGGAWLDRAASFLGPWTRTWDPLHRARARSGRVGVAHARRVASFLLRHSCRGVGTTLARGPHRHHRLGVTPPGYESRARRTTRSPSHTTLTVYHGSPFSFVLP